VGVGLEPVGHAVGGRRRESGSGARFDVIKIFGAHSFKYKIRTGRSTRSGDLYITTLRRYRYNLRDRWARAERGEARCEEATEATRPPERGSKGGSEAHTTMSACREEWGALCASGRGGATVTRDSGGATLCQCVQGAACGVHGGGAPQTSRLVRRSCSPRVLIYACRCVFRVITGAGVACGRAAWRGGSGGCGGCAAAPRGLLGQLG
jgi:hypothetical protein